MNKLEEIREERDLVRQNRYAFSITEIGERDNEAIDFLLRAVEQLVGYLRVAFSLPMRYEMEEAAQQAYDAWKALDPDIRELLEKGHHGGE